MQHPRLFRCLYTENLPTNGCVSVMPFILQHPGLILVVTIRLKAEQKKYLIVFMVISKPGSKFLKQNTQ